MNEQLNEILINGEFELSKHCQEEAIRRSIPIEFIKNILLSPQQIIETSSDRHIYQSKVAFDNSKEYLVRLIVEDTATIKRVITVYRTSKIQKYWR